MTSPLIPRVLIPTRWKSAALVFLGALSVSLAESYEWKNLKIGGAGFVTGIITNRSEQGLVYCRTDVGGAYRWESTGETWVPLLDWLSEEDRGYLGVESLATDETDPRNLYLLVGIEYFSEGRTAILRSSDYGRTFDVVDVSGQFRVHGNGMGRQNGERLQVDPNNSDVLYAGSRDAGLFKSLDAGRTWYRLEALDVTTTPNGNGVCLVVVDRESVTEGASQTLFLGISRYGENLYRSDDAGLSFQAIPGGPGATLMPQRAVLAGDGHLYVTYANGAGPHPHWIEGLGEPMNTGGIWKYDTNTGTWTEVTPTGFATPFGGISVDPADPGHLVASTINTWLPQGEGPSGDRFYVTWDGGDSWVDVVDRGFELDPNGITWLENRDYSIHWTGSIELDPFDPRRVFVVSGNGIFTTSDIEADTAVWAANVNGLEETVPLDLISLPGGPVLSAIGDYDGFVHTDLEAYAPIHRPQMGTTTGLAYAGLDPSIVIRCGDLLYISSDGGSSWTQTATNNGKKGRVAVSADGSVFLHSPESDGTAASRATYRSIDGGSNWSAVEGLELDNARPVADPVDPELFYLYDPKTGSFLRSEDGGVGFAPVNRLATGGGSRMATVPGLEGHLWVPLGPSGLARTTDGGESFAILPQVEACQSVGTGLAAPDSDTPTVFIWGEIGGQQGVFRSVDQGETWVRINDDAHQYGGPGNGSFVIGDNNVFGRVYMSTAGRGIVYGEGVEPQDSIALDVWLDRYFDTEQQADASVSGLFSDFDRDGRPTLLEWVTASDPTRFDPSPALLFEAGENQPSLIVTTQAELVSARLEIQASDDLVLWLPVEGALTALPPTLDPDNQTRTIRYVLNPSAIDAGALFFRLVATQM